MTYTICYGLIFLVEILISVFYFETKFDRKVSKKILYTALILMYIALYSSRLLNLTWVNVTSFFVCNFLLLFTCYQAKIKACIFHSGILLIMMSLTESIVMFASSMLFDVDLLACLDDSINLIIQSSISKIMYLLVIYIILKVSTKEYKSENNSLSIFLVILPISSVLLMYAISYALAKYKMEPKYFSLLLVGIVTLLISNIIVFWIYEFTLKTHKRNLELEIEREKERSNTEYYELLNQQNENTKIVIHDIKHHLNTIKNLIPKDNDSISNYIDNIIDDFGINNTIDYCNNVLVNLITNRYRKICEDSKIKFNIDIRNTQIDFMSEPDITALLDNLLENAVEATSKANVKFIDFSINKRKNNFLSIIITNSVKEKVKITDNLIISSKKSKGIHGVGLRSIKRVVEKYDGEMKMSFDENALTFTTSIIFRIP